MAAYTCTDTSEVLAFSPESLERRYSEQKVKTQERLRSNEPTPRLWTLPRGFSIPLTWLLFYDSWNWESSTFCMTKSSLSENDWPCKWNWNVDSGLMNCEVCDLHCFPRPCTFWPTPPDLSSLASSQHLRSLASRREPGVPNGSARLREGRRKGCTSESIQRCKAFSHNMVPWSKSKPSKRQH